MNHLHYLFTLRHPRRFWCSSLVIAVASAIVLGPWIDNCPWLVAIPLVAGGLLVALGELWMRCMASTCATATTTHRRPAGIPRLTLARNNGRAIGHAGA